MPTATAQEPTPNHPVQEMVIDVVPVLVVGNFMSSGGFGSRAVCEDLTDRLRASGWPVITASQRAWRPARLTDMLSTTWRNRNRYDVAQVDVYSGLSFFWAEAVCELLKHLRRPFVLALRGGALPEFSKRWPHRVRRLLGSAAAVTTPSPYLLSELRSFRGDLRLLPNPIDVSAHDGRVRRGVRPRFVWLRAFHRIYNPSLAPRVISLVAREFPECHLFMFGPDKGDGTLEATRDVIRALNVESHVSLPGAIAKSEVPSRLVPGDIFLNTPDVDNAPVSVLEAMASGLCIVSTNVGGVPYLAEDGVDALLVPPDDPEAMADAVRRILHDPTLAERLSRNARRKAEHHDWATILPRWKALFREIAHLDGPR